MARTNISYTDNIRRYGEGRSNVENEVHIPPQSSAFVRMIVLDVISDPNNDNIDEKKKTMWHGMGVTNMSYVDVLPRNTIVAKKVGEDQSPMFVFPFFPSHFSFPCKPGECVWAMFENPEASYSDIAYWFCRVVEPHIADDVNHTHLGRSLETSLKPGTKERHENGSSSPQGTTGDEAWHELRNSPVALQGERRVSLPEGLFLRGESEDIFETLITKSDASKLTVYESVPRYRKRPGDVVLEGSNNSLIVLGTDRTGPVAQYVTPEEETDKKIRNKVPKYPDSDLQDNSGTIDIVVGRGQTDPTYGKSADTTSIKNANGKSKGKKIKSELNKTIDAKSSSEGDVDFKNDRSRILVSQRTKVDSNFDLSQFNSQFGTKDNVRIEDNSQGDSAIIIKSDKVRLIARSDLEIIVTGYKSNKSPDGKSRKDESEDLGSWSSIVIKQNGDIIFKPSDKGYIKLGDDTADRAILCTDLPAVATDGKVDPTTPALTTTMGGLFGGTGTPSQGTWAKKILVTGANAADPPKPKK